MSSASPEIVDLADLSTDKSTLTSGFKDGEETEGGDSNSERSESSFSFGLSPIMNPSKVPRTPLVRGNNARRSSHRFRMKSPDSSSEASSPSATTPSGATGGGVAAQRRSSSRTPQRRRFPESKGYTSQYVNSVPGRLEQADRSSRAAGGSRRSPLVLSSSQGSGAGGEAGSDSSDGDGSSEGGGLCGRKPAGKQRVTPGAVKETRLWTRPGEKELLYRLVAKHCPSKHTSTADKNKEWWACVEQLLDDTVLTITVKGSSLEDGTSKLLEKRVTVNMADRMKGMSDDEIITRLKNIFTADKSSWSKLKKQERGLTGVGSDDEAETSEARALEEAVLAWEAGVAAKKSKEPMRAAKAAKAGDIRDRAKDVHHARSKKRRTGTASSKGSGKGKGKASGDVASGVRLMKKVRRRRAASDDDDDSDYEDLDHDHDPPPNRSSSRATSTLVGRSESDGNDDDDDDDEEEESATQLASGAFGRSQRSGKGGGKRKREIPPLSSGVGNDAVSQKVMKLLDNITEERGGRQRDEPLSREDVRDMVKEEVTSGVMNAMRSFFASHSAVPTAHGAAMGVAPPGMPQPPFGMHGVSWPGSAGFGAAHTAMATGGVPVSAFGAAPAGPPSAAVGVPPPPAVQPTGPPQAAHGTGTASAVPSGDGRSQTMLPPDRLLLF